MSTMDYWFWYARNHNDESNLQSTYTGSRWQYWFDKDESLGYKGLICHALFRWYDNNASCLFILLDESSFILIALDEWRNNHSFDIARKQQQAIVGKYHNKYSGWIVKANKYQP